MRNPNVYFGPPDSLAYSVKDLEKQAQENFESFMDSLEYRRSLNPFTGEPMDTDADVKRLLERMKKSKIPPSRQRMPMQEGGQVKDMPSYSVSRPEFEAFMSYAATEEEAEETRRKQMENFMSMLGSDKRILPPDKYTTRIADEDGMMIMSETEIPKLSTAYMSSFGFATPLSKRQGALLQRKMIAPETLNPSVKGLINRVLVQRLGNENN
jgi:predicted RNase H-like HicB family nuclease